jgi:type IX secretion system PorP/SprF family membrane protein
MKKLIFACTIVLVGKLSAQQLTQLSQINNSPEFVNPGATAAYEQTDFSLIGRNQWLGFKNEAQGNVSPKTAVLNFSTVLNKSDKKSSSMGGLRHSKAKDITPKMTTGRLKHGLGGQVLADEYGAFRSISVSGVYSIHVPLTKKLNLSMGTRAGVTNHSFLNDKALPMSILTNSSFVDETYQRFISEKMNRMFMDLGVGLFLYNEHFFVGLSANQLTKDLVSFSTAITNFVPQIHYDFIAGGKIKITKEYTVTPSVLVKFMNPVMPTIQTAVRLDYQQQLWGGLGYRLNDAVYVMAGGMLTDKIGVGYSYDHSISRISNVNKGGHELLLRFVIP